jgi:putative peptide zinc metalloprotease protein
MTGLIYAVASKIDGARSLDEIANLAGEELRRQMRPEDVAFLIHNKLEPAGLIASPDRPAPIKASEAPILGLRIRAKVVPAAAVHAITRLFLPLFNPVILLQVVIGVVLFDQWLLFQHGMAKAAQQVILHPSLVFIVIALTVASTALHEIGHATACRYGGARPGAIGAGIYLVWPVFYSDVTDSYRLNRMGRLRTDLGGVYFNLIATALMCIAYLATHYEPLVIAILLVQMDALHQFFPFFRLDGYYVASDLIGVPDLFMRMRPMLLSFIPGRPMHPLVKQLKPWARYALATWVYLTFVVIAGLYFLLIKALPRILATAWQSFMLHLTEVGVFRHQHEWGAVTIAVLDEITLVFPLFALAVTALVMGRKLLRMWGRMEKRPTKRVAVAIAAAIVLLIPLPTITSISDYKPIKPSERGTLPAPAGPNFQVPGGGGGTDAQPMTVASPKPKAFGAAASPRSQPVPPTPVGAGGGSEWWPSPTPSGSPSAAPSPSPSPEESPSPSPSPS